MIIVIWIEVLAIAMTFIGTLDIVVLIRLPLCFVLSLAMVVLMPLLMVVLFVIPEVFGSLSDIS